MREVRSGRTVSMLLLGLLVVVMLAAGVLLWRRLVSSGDRAGSSATPPPAVAFSQPVPPPDGQAPGATVRKVGARSILAPPPSHRLATVAPPRPPSNTAGAPAPPAEGAPADGGPRLSPVGTLEDRRQTPTPDGAEIRQRLQTRLEAVRTDIEGCLRAWTRVDPSTGARVMLDFELGPGGLERVSVVDYAEVPFGPRSCFASAVYGVDWAGVTSQPIRVTHRFEYAADAGSSRR